MERSFGVGEEGAEGEAGEGRHGWFMDGRRMMEEAPDTGEVEKLDTFGGVLCMFILSFEYG